MTVLCPVTAISVTGLSCDIKEINIKVKVARRTGLEPATPGVTGRYSNQLSYHRAIKGGVTDVADGVNWEMAGGVVEVSEGGQIMKRVGRQRV